MGRRRSDRGAATAETAIVLPILLFVMFAIMETGGAVQSYSSVAGAVRSAGRVGSISGADPMVDALTLGAIARDLGSGHDVVQLVAIWHAVGPGDPVPAGCLPAVPATPNAASVGVGDGGTDALGACNVYLLPGATGGAFSMADGTAAYPADHYFGCQGTADPVAAQKVDCNWPGKDRRAVTSPRTATPHPTDFVGVYIRLNHSYYTKIFGSTLTIADQGITLIEPQGYDFT